MSEYFSNRQLMGVAIHDPKVAIPNWWASSLFYTTLHWFFYILEMWYSRTNIEVNVQNKIFYRSFADYEKSE